MPRRGARIADHLESIIELINGRAAVYFPSYAIMHEVVKAANFDLPIVLEERHTKIVDLLRFLKPNEQCVIFVVSRCKMSEGVDMSLNGRSMLSDVTAVGLPYPKRTELQTALVKYFREKFGNKSMEYTNGIPCLSVLAQSAGKLLRSPEDKGIIVMMDGRAARMFKQKLLKDWREDMKAHYDIEKLSERIRTSLVVINFYVCASSN